MELSWCAIRLLYGGITIREAQDGRLDVSVQIQSYLIPEALMQQLRICSGYLHLPAMLAVSLSAVISIQCHLQCAGNPVLIVATQ